VPKPPSWNEIRGAAAEFAARWADDEDENAGAQLFWRDFLGIFGVDVKRVGTFEARAKRTSTGRRGRIDLLWPDVLVAEHKSVGKSLSDAEQQALDYLDSVDQDHFPGIVLASDFARMRILDLSSGKPAYEFPLKNLVNEIDRFGFIAGYKPRDFGGAEEARANIKAARLMGRLYEQLSKTGYEGHESSILLTRLLFLLFGDDTGMWEKNLFGEFVTTRTQPDGSDLGAQLAMLFQNLNRHEAKRPLNLDELIRRFPYVNGGLFHDRIDIPSFDREMRDELVACTRFDWGAISPAIFGSMFQAVKSKEARRELGEHYTTEENILKALRPLFLDDLRAEFNSAKDSTLKLKRLRVRLGALRYMDPACGCGNFLVVAYREMRALELDILTRLRDLSPGETQLSLDPTLGLQVRLDQFYGIEIEEWPARIAETAMFLVDHQANLTLAQEFGQAPDRLPIEIAATICKENATAIDWNDVLPSSECTYVFGNPPFVGMSLMNDNQQADNRRVFGSMPGLSRTGRLDYVACWYAKSIEYMKGTGIRTALVSTNSISQGEQARALGPLLANNGFLIDFAHRTFSWSSEAPGAAAVHVVICGFSEGGLATTKHLYDYPKPKGQPLSLTARNINIYLADSDVTAIGKHATPLVPVPRLTEGNRPQDGGGLIISREERAAMLGNDPIAAKYLRRLIGARDMIHGDQRWCLWLVDADPKDLARSNTLKSRLAIVAAARLNSPTPSAAARAKTPGLFFAIRQPTKRWLCIPRHSSEQRALIPMAFFKPTDIAHDSTLTLAGADEYLFGILQSAMFTTWAKTVSGRIKSDIRISPDLSYNSFPFPTGLTEGQRRKIRGAAKAVLDARAAHRGSTLADLYGSTSTPPDLARAHRALDAAVDMLFGRRTQPTEAERQAILFAKYRDLSAPLEQRTAVKGPGRRVDRVTG
jgi:hypothetical protein